MCANAIWYGLWGRVWRFLDSKLFHQRSPASIARTTGRLWLDAQHQELVMHIKHTREMLSKLNVLSAEGELMSEMLMMSLHICSEDVQRFAGRFGEEEVRAALPTLREWIHKDEHLHANWHAGQVLRAARKLPRTQLRGFLAIAVYHACLTLWMSALLTRRSGTASGNFARTSVGLAIGVGETSMHPEGNRSFTMSEQSVILNGDETPVTRAYLSLGRGVPALQVDGGVGELQDPTVIPTVMMSIFRENYPAQSESLPPLRENLGSLMNDLSKTPGA
jgi:hypothetical protein